MLYSVIKTPINWESEFRVDNEEHVIYNTTIATVNNLKRATLNALITYSNDGKQNIFIVNILVCQNHWCRKILYTCVFAQYRVKCWNRIYSSWCTGAILIINVLKSCVDSKHRLYGEYLSDCISFASTKYKKNCMTEWTNISTGDLKIWREGNCKKTDMNTTQTWLQKQDR